MRRLLAVLAALSLLGLGGCTSGRGVYANYRAVEDMLLVKTLGVDAGPGGLILSAASARPRDGAPTILRGEASAIAPGLEALQAHTPRGQLYFAHTQYIVLGRDYAAGGVDALLDYVERDVRTRMGAAIFVMRSGDAAALLTGSGEDWDVSDVLAAARQEAAQCGAGVSDVRETAVALSEYGAALVCALRAVETEGSVFGLPPGRAAVPDGCGILKDGALVGFLSQREAEAAALLRGDLGAVTRTLDYAGGRVTLEVRCGAPEMSFSSVGEGGILLRVRAAPTAAITGTDAPGGVTDAAALAAIAAAVDDALRAELTQIIAREKAEGCDFLLLQRALRRQGLDPDALPEDWLETLKAAVTVETVVRHSYDLQERVGTDGGGAP